MYVIARVKSIARAKDIAIEILAHAFVRMVDI